MSCNLCGQEFDMRNLSQVFAHEECGGIPVDYSKLGKINKTSVRIGEPILYINDGDEVGLN